jgi:hypothetical protein
MYDDFKINKLFIILQAKIVIKYFSQINIIPDYVGLWSSGMRRLALWQIGTKVPKEDSASFCNV